MNKFLPYLVSIVFFFLALQLSVPAQDKQQLDTAKTKEKTRDINPFSPDQYHYVSWQDNMMGASPEAAKMTKYADTPVSNAYGLAEIGIPIYTVQSRSLKLPIALSYDSSGVKPEEISGIVGLGWNLQAGGVITRTIIGRVDTGDEIPPETTDPAYAEGLVGQANSDNDTEYDRYSYNFCGYSGSFYRIPFRGIVPTEPTELIISGAGPFTITDKDGTQYIFGLAETSTRYMGSYDPNAPLVNQTGNYYNLITAWYLTEIRSMDGTDVITISYLQQNAFSHVSHSYYRSISFPYKYMGNDVWLTNLSGGFDPTPAFQTREWSFTTTQEWRPHVVSSITYNGGSVSFDYEGYSEPGGQLYGGSRRSYPSFLSSITVNEGGQNGLLNWTFDRDTTGDYRLLLAAVTQKGQNGSTIEKWTLGYDTPNTAMGENSVDLFGYYNGGGNNGTKAFLRPYNDESTVPFSVANRNHNSALVGRLSLNSIKTASGSLTRYNYASNSIPTNGQSNLFPSTIQIGQRISSIVTYDLSQGGERLVRRRNFSYSNPGITIPIYAFQMGAFISTSENNSCPDGVGGGQWYGPSSPIRVGSVLYNDQSNLPGMPLESARIFYQQVMEEISEESVPLVRTVWQYDGTGAVSTGGGGTVWTPSDSHDESHVILPHGPNHFHQRVPTYIPRNGTQSNPTTPLGYHIMDQNRPQLCNPTKVIHYKKDGTQFKKVSQTDYTYEGWSEYLQVGLTLTLRTSPNTNGHENTNAYCLNDVDQQQVDRRIYYQRLKERVDTEYLDDNSTKSVKTTYKYAYTPGSRSSFYSGGAYYADNLNYVPAMGALQSPRQEVQVYFNDNSKTYIRNIIYPDELVGVSNCSWAATLVSNHYLLPVGEEIIIGASPTNKAGRYVTWGQVPVASWGGGVSNNTLLKPRKTEVYRNGQHVSRDINYNLYDSGGKPLEIEADGQPYKTYAWGYNHRFPIAEVTGKSFQQVRNALNNNQKGGLDMIAGMSTLSSSYLTLVRTGLRTNQADAFTTIQTYTPPFGLAMEEDPSGRKIQYTYDYGGRLSSVKDNNGDKLQEYAYSLTNGENGAPNRIDSKTYFSGTSFFKDDAYFDGLGRTLQLVQERVSTNERDLVTPFTPDFLDHEDVREYLPYPASTNASTRGTYRSDALTNQQSFYGNGIKAYKENSYELSKRNRILSSSLPGFTETTTFPNFPSVAPLFGALNLTYSAGNNMISVDGYYPSGHFKVNGALGPDGSLVISYNDELETPYLEQVRLNSSGSYLGTLASTYYIRDVWGRVVCVVPPAEAAQLTATTVNFSTANCYTYSYDNRDRVIRRQLPGRVPEEITYNDADMPTMRRRLASDGVALEYFFTSYDSFNRPIKEEYRYGENNARITLAEYYYDSYQTGFPAFYAESGYATAADTLTRGLKTAERITVLPADVAPSALTPSNTTACVQRAYYYDAKGNVIQIAESNAFGGISRTSFSYDLAGNLLKHRQSMAPGANAGAAVLDRTYTYDARLRLSQVTAQLNNGSLGKLTYTYDDFGRIATLERGTALDTTQYTYTLQGWLETAISTSWEETLRYQSPSRTTTDALPGKAGLITEWTTKQKGASGTGSTNEETYGFSYDKAGRLTNSIRYLESDTTGMNTLAERDITYDASGNLLTLNRYGSDSSTTPTESLSFTYNGPKRVGWVYDPNGNVTSDAINNVSIAWNIIDQPRMLTSGSNSTQRFYLADGTLSHIQDGNQIRIYLGDIVFKTVSGRVSVESAGWEGGRLLPGTGADMVLYMVTDHLGSVRVVKDGTGTVRQRNDYYPYGSVSRSWNSNNTDTPDKHYRFGGKEIAGTVLNVTFIGADDYLDFGARIYSPPTAMWLSQDIMAEKYYSLNPYAYCAGNPVSLVDSDGTDWYISASGNLRWFDSNNPEYIYEEETYYQIGASVSILQDDGSFLNYYQNYQIGDSTSEPVNAENLVLANSSLTGLLLSRASHLPDFAKADLMVATIHQGQYDFLSHPVTRRTVGLLSSFLGVTDLVELFAQSIIGKASLTFEELIQMGYRAVGDKKNVRRVFGRDIQKDLKELSKTYGGKIRKEGNRQFFIYNGRQVGTHFSTTMKVPTLNIPKNGSSGFYKIRYMK